MKYNVYIFKKSTEVLNTGLLFDFFFLNKDIKIGINEH